MVVDPPHRPVHGLVIVLTSAINRMNSTVAVRCSSFTPPHGSDTLSDRLSFTVAQ
jgi:hypothetical protein